MNKFIETSWFKSLLFYLIAGPVVVYIIKSGQFKSGPCNPGLDVLSLLLLVLISFILMLVNLIKIIRKGRNYLPPFLVHLLAFILIIIMSSF